MFKSKKFIGLLFLTFLLIELSILLGAFDLKIWNSISYQAGDFWYATLDVGQLIGVYILTLSGVIVALYYSAQTEKSSKLKSYAGFSITLVGIVLCIYILNQLTSKLIAIILILFTGALFTVVTLLMKKVSPDRLFQLYCIALTSIVYIIAVAMVIAVIGAFWGRTAPRDISSIHQFTRFYIPQGASNGISFPSLYVANASIAYVITMLAPLFKKKLVKRLLYIGPILWIATVSFNSIYIGAGFASDALFACTLSLLLFYFAKNLTLKKIAKSLES